MPSLNEDLLTHVLAHGPRTVYAKHPTARGLLSRPAGNIIQVGDYVRQFTNSSVGWDFFICPNQHSAAGKPRIADMVRFHWMVVDIDPITAEANRSSDLLAIADLVDRRFNHQSSVVSTGRGLHLWYRVTTLLPDDALRFLYSAKRHCEDLTEALARLGWAIDPTCFDLSHIFRLPGTINHKNGLLCDTIRFSANIMLSTLLPRYEPPVLAVPERSPLAGGADSLAILCALSPQARNFIMHGAIPHVESRHRQAFITAVQLLELGVPLDTALALVGAGAARCNPPMTDHEALVRRTYAS